MVRLLKSQAVEPRKQKVPFQASRNIRHLRRDTRAALAVLESLKVQDGNTDTDWQLWEDSMVAFDSQFQSMKDQFTYIDAFAGVYQER